jgi:Uma2 family endonuclease
MIEAMSTETATKKLFTTDEFLRILDAGIFPPDTRFELIRGEIIQMPETRGPHTGRVNKLTRLFTSTLGETVIVSVQNEVAIPNLTPMSCPKPDVALLRPMPEFFGPFAPVPDEVLLLVEISHTTARYDRETKASLYAEAGIAEYWILNIPENILEVRTDPADGQYRRTKILRPGQTISPQQLPGITFSVDDILN